MIKTGQSGDVDDFVIVTTAGEALSARDACYIDTADGKAYKCDADDTTKLGFVGFAQEGALLNAAVNLVCSGPMTGFAGLTINAVYFLSGTAGAITATAPANAVVVCRATSASVIKIDTNYRPDISCHVYQTGATGFTITYTKMDFGAELFDTDTMHDNSTNPSRITFTKAGKYLVGVNVSTPANNVGCAVKMRLNDATDLCFAGPSNPSGSDNGISLTTLKVLSAGDYIEFYVKTDGDGGTQNTSGDLETHAWAVRLAP